MDCFECNHETHDAGRCKKCNCGQSEIVSNSVGFIRVFDPDYASYLEGVYANTHPITNDKGDYQLCQ